MGKHQPRYFVIYWTLVYIKSVIGSFHYSAGNYPVITEWDVPNENEIRECLFDVIKKDHPDATKSSIVITNCVEIDLTSPGSRSWWPQPELLPPLEENDRL